MSYQATTPAGGRSRRRGPKGSPAKAIAGQGSTERGQATLWVESGPTEEDGDALCAASYDESHPLLAELVTRACPTDPLVVLLRDVLALALERLPARPKGREKRDKARVLAFRRSQYVVHHASLALWATWNYGGAA